MLNCPFSRETTNLIVLHMNVWLWITEFLWVETKMVYSHMVFQRLNFLAEASFSVKNNNI